MTKPVTGVQRLQALTHNADATRQLHAQVPALRNETPGSAGATAEVWLYGVIGSYWDGLDAGSFARAIAGLEVDEISVRIHSPGGAVLDGIAILNALRQHKARVVVTVDGLAASAASFIAMAGDEVRMAPGAQMMIHDAWLYTVGNAAELRADADFIEKQSDNIARLYASRAGGTSEQWREAMLAETWYSDEEAVAAGLADTVLGAADVPDEAAAAAALRFDLSLFNFAGRDHAPAPHVSETAAAAAGTPQTPGRTSAGGSNNTEGGPAVAFSNEQITNLRATLGLAETADEAAIVAAVSAVVEENLEERPAAQAPAAAVVPEGHVVVPEARLSDLEAAAQQGVAAARRLHEQERTTFLDSVRTKFLPANRAAWEAEYDRNPEATRAALTASPDIVPTAEVGHDQDGVTAEQYDDTVLDAYAASLGLSKEDLRG